MTEQIVLNCRHCGQKNRINIEKALYHTDEIHCGKCKKNIFLGQDEKLDFFDLGDFIHPMDQSTMETIKKIPAITSILKFLVKNTSEKFFKVMHYQNYIRVSENQYPDLYKLYKEMVYVLNLSDNEPELFVYKSPYINAYTYGVDKHFIGISTAALEELSDEQVQDVLAHELGHVVLGHVLYKMAAVVIAQLSVSVANKTLGLGGVLISPIRYALLSWSRASELSADRVAIMATRKLKAAHLTTLKLAGGVSTYKDEDYNFENFLAQSENARKIEDESILTKIYNFWENQQITHPFPLWRAGELDKWAKEGDYLRVISKNHVTERGLIRDVQKCENCSNEYSVRLTVCPYCGHSKEKSDESFFDKLKGLF